MLTNKDMVDYLVSISALKTPRIIEGFLSVDRADFVPERYRAEAYENYPLPIGHSQTISQPYTVAFMIELLQPQEDSEILDVGCGSCWTTAILASIARKGHIIGVEIIKELIDFCTKNLAKYNFSNVTILHGNKLPDKHNGFDRILVSASANRVPEELITAMKDNARMVIPVQSSIMLVEKKENQIITEEHYGFAFVPLR